MTNNESRNIVIISKDVLSARYLPTYGNKYWKTPNIDELAAKGTVFRRHYTAAPSTAMAFTSMFTGKYPYQTGRKDYTEIEQFDIDGVKTLFDLMYEKGYDCHLLWSSNYIKMAERFSRCFGNHTIHHDKLELNQYVGPHMPGDLSELKRDDKVAEDNYQSLIHEIDTIDRTHPIFLWVHLPHVLKGRIAYGDDIDLLDRFVGDIRIRFGDFIIVTADHGSNDGKDGKTGYGFDVFESSVHIPLITPKIDGRSEVFDLTSNVDLIDLVAFNRIPKHEYVLSDTAYFEQAHRKLAIIKGNYKFVYDKMKKTISLYDIDYDPSENIDLNKRIMFDSDRRRYVVTSQVLYYPYWDNVQSVLTSMNGIFNSIWCNGSYFKNLKDKFLKRLKNVYGYWRAVFQTYKKRANK